MELKIENKIDQANSIISIIMPAYNAEKFIKEAIYSVINQTYKNWELLIVNDGSEDNTKEIIQEFVESNHRIIGLNIEHIGKLGIIRNIGLQKATGNYIAFLDSDDLYEPDALENLLNAMKENSSALAVYGFFNCIDEDGNFIKNIISIKSNNDNPKTPDTHNYKHTWDGFLSSRIPNAMQSLLIKRTILNETGLQHTESHWPDYLFYLKMYGLFPDKLVYINKYIFKYRIYKSSSTFNFKRNLEILGNINDHCKWIVEEVNIPSKNKDFVSKIYAYNFRNLLRSSLKNSSFVFKVLNEAFRCPEMKLKHWLIHCLPYLPLSYIKNV